jgi:hypothetical protein
MEIEKVMKKARTELVARHFVPDWAKLETAFPGIRACPTLESKALFLKEIEAKHPDKKAAIDACYIEVKADERRVLDRVVTDAFAEFIAAQLITETSAFGDFKYHHSGEGTNAEDATDTGLQTPRENSREVGTQVQGSTTKSYKSVATITYTGSYNITEHGLFNTAGTGTPPTGGTLMDRTKFTQIAVAATDRIEYTFTIALTSGG